MVKGRNFFLERYDGKRQKERKGPVGRLHVSGDAEMVSETDVDLSGTSSIVDGDKPGPSNIEILPVKIDWNN